MNFKLQYGEDFDENYLKRIMEIDEIVYAEDGYVGELKNMVARYLSIPDSLYVSKIPRADVWRDISILSPVPRRSTKISATKASISAMTISDRRS